MRSLYTSLLIYSFNKFLVLVIRNIAMSIIFLVLRLFIVHLESQRVIRYYVSDTHSSGFSTLKIFLSNIATQSHIGP